MFNFEKLDVWHKTIALADMVYELTSMFPSDERFGLTNQMRRVAVSISSNIAEGTSRSSSLDYSRFIEMATGSLFEVVSQATISKRQGFLSGPDYEKIHLAAEEQSRMLSGLRNSLLSRLREEEAPYGNSPLPLNSQLSTFVTPPTS
jgi:four helix bundle protein